MNDKVIYLHFKKTNNEVFYVGIGTAKRPSSKQSRSRLWHNVVKKHSYYIKVIDTGLSLEDACSREIELIELIGRRCDGGTLVNHTLGGEGNLGSNHWLGKTHSKETIEKCRKINLGRKTSEATKKKLRKINTGKKHSESSKLKRSLNSPLNKAIINIDTKEVYRNLRIACELEGLNPNTIRAQLAGRKNIQKYNKLRYYGEEKI